MKTITLFLITVLTCSLLYGQTEESECVTCSQNTINLTGFASGIGTDNQASGEQSFVGGHLSNAEGNYSFAFGYSAYSGGTNAISLGYQANATEMHSVAIGRQAYAQSPAAFALGLSANAQAESSYVFGEFLKATASRTIIIGHGAGIGDNYLTNNIPESMMIGIDSNVPTLFVSSSNGAGKTGKIGIGNITSPTAKLHIKADINEDAAIMLQPTGSAYSGRIFFGDNNHSISAKANANLTFSTGNGNHFEFINGNAGFGTDQPAAKIQVKDGDIFIEDIDRGIIMKSPDGNCWRGTVNNQGQMQFTQVDCDNLAVSTPESKALQNSGISIFPNPTGNTVTVEISAEHAGALLSIKSPEGKELVSSRISNTRNTINLGSYPAGFYFFYISLDGNLLDVKKVVKE